MHVLRVGQARGREALARLWLGALRDICFFTEQIGPKHFSIPSPELDARQSGHGNGRSPCSQEADVPAQWEWVGAGAGHT